MTDPLPVQLLCGADADALLEQVTDRPYEPKSLHQRRCVHCQAAVAEFTRLWAPLREAAAEPIRAPQALLGWVFDQVRAAAQTPSWAVLAQQGGLTRVAVDVVVEVVRQAAISISGVRALFPTVTTAGPDAVIVGKGADQQRFRVGVSGTSVAVVVTVAAGYGCDLRVLGDNLAGAIVADLERLLGLHVGAVTVHIDDVIAA